jgi:hypothetical protein
MILAGGVWVCEKESAGGTFSVNTEKNGPAGTICRHSMNTILTVIEVQ